MICKFVFIMQSIVQHCRDTPPGVSADASGEASLRDLLIGICNFKQLDKYEFVEKGLTFWEKGCIILQSACADISLLPIIPGA